MKNGVYVICFQGTRAWALDRGYNLLGDVKNASKYIRGKNAIESDKWAPTYGCQKPTWAQDATSKNTVAVWLEPQPTYKG